MKENIPKESFVELDIKISDSCSLAAAMEQNGHKIQNGDMAPSETIVGNGGTVQVQMSQDLSPEVVKNEPIIGLKGGNVLSRFVANKTAGMSQREVSIMIVFALVEFFAATIISIQAPFFPDVATQKGASAFENGLVFGVFELMVFCFSPIFGTYMAQIGPKKLFNIGIFVTGICCVIFGCLNNFEGRYTFIISCLVVRMIEGIGDAAFVTASFTIIAIEFPDTVASKFAIIETFYGLGLIVGPTLGGPLYQLGGYSLPFVLMGGLLFLSAIATYYVLPEIEGSGSNETSKPIVTASGFDMFKMLRIGPIAMIAYSIIATSAGVGFLSAHLDLHFKQFEVSKTVVGALFVLHGGVYALTAPGWGWICDNATHPKYITFLGSMFTICGFILIGPLPIFPFDTLLWMTCIGQIIFGLGLGATLVSAFIQILKDSISHGYPDSVSTYGLVSGLWTSMLALGFLVGPVLGGILVDHVNFRYASVSIIGGQLVLVVMLLYFFWSQRVKSNNKSEANISSVEVPKINGETKYIIKASGSDEENGQKYQNSMENPAFVVDDPATVVVMAK